MTLMVEFDKKEMLEKLDAAILSQRQIMENAKKTLDHLAAIREVFEPQSLDVLHISVRASVGLRNAGIDSLVQLTGRSKQELIDSKCIGVKSLREIEDALRNIGLSLRK